MTDDDRSRPWNLPRSAITPERVYLDRREFLRKSGLATLGAAALGPGALAACDPQDGRGAGADSASADAGRVAQSGPLDNVPETPTADLYPEARRIARYTAGDRHGSVTDEEVVATYNNFYEFGTDKQAVWERTDAFEARPWQIEIEGLVESPGTFDLVDLERELGLEERIYRLRCVEAWSVVVPWIGFPFSKLLERVRPTGEARYVRMVSFDRPDQAPGQREQTWYEWPYYEALRLDEAMNEVAFLATGMYGHPLQKQNGAPIRLAVPWKYGFKSIKSIRRIELTRERPPSFWNDLQPDEYGWLSNVDPTVDHPRWSQATEEVVATGEEVPTLPYNGYGEWVSGLYPCPTPEGDVPHAPGCG